MNNLEFLNDAEIELRNIKCGLNIKKRLRIKGYLNSIDIVRKSILRSKSDRLRLVDRLFLNDLFYLIICEGGFKNDLSL